VTDGNDTTVTYNGFGDLGLTVSSDTPCIAEAVFSQTRCIPGAAQESLSSCDSDNCPNTVALGMSKRLSRFGRFAASNNGERFQFLYDAAQDDNLSEVILNLSLENTFIDFELKGRLLWVYNEVPGAEWDNDAYEGPASLVNPPDATVIGYEESDPGSFPPYGFTYARQTAAEFCATEGNNGCEGMSVQWQGAPCAYDSESGQCSATVAEGQYVNDKYGGENPPETL
jgi:hypothetical protein